MPDYEQKGPDSELIDFISLYVAWLSAAVRTEDHKVSQEHRYWRGRQQKEAEEHGGQATAKHRAGQAAEGGKSFCEKRRC